LRGLVAEVAGVALARLPGALRELPLECLPGPARGGGDLGLQVTVEPAYVQDHANCRVRQGHALSRSVFPQRGLLLLSSS